MPTREPVPPPKRSVASVAGAERVVEVALLWRRMERARHPGAELELDNLRHAVDELLVVLANPPTSPPPPRKKS